jgi:hypothetical protein
MPEVKHRPVAWTPRSILSEVVREVNLSLRQLAQEITRNYRDGYPQVDATVIVNTTQIVWIPQKDYTVNWIALRTSSGTASVTPRINSTAMGVTGGTPIAANTTATRYSVTTDNFAADMSTVDLVVSGLTGGANLAVSLGVRAES